MRWACSVAVAGRSWSTRNSNGGKPSWWPRWLVMRTGTWEMSSTKRPSARKAQSWIAKRWRFALSRPGRRARLAARQARGVDEAAPSSRGRARTRCGTTPRARLLPPAPTVPRAEVRSGSARSTSSRSSSPTRAPRTTTRMSDTRHCGALDVSHAPAAPRWRAAELRRPVPAYGVPTRPDPTRKCVPMSEWLVDISRVLRVCQPRGPRRRRERERSGGSEHRERRKRTTLGGEPPRAALRS